MEEILYDVLVDNTVIGQNLSLDYAVLFIKAILQYYFMEPNISVTLQRKITNDVIKEMEYD